MNEPRKLRVFLCHASQDKPVVRELYKRLLAEGWIDPWLDEEKLLPGQDFDLEIYKATRDADAIIICLSRISVAKEGYVNKEIRRALNISEEKPEGAMYVIPLRLDDCIPSFEQLKKLHWLDYFTPNAHERLLKSLHTRIDVLRLQSSEIQNVNSENQDRDLYRFIQILPTESVSYSFYIGKYPVTIAQYERFLSAPDYVSPLYWMEFPEFDENCKRTGDWKKRGFEWLHKELKKLKSIVLKPPLWDDKNFGSSNPNHPIVSVSWYEANAYCKWLFHNWDTCPENTANSKMKPVAIRLPLETEWVIAAGGEIPKGRYPWDEAGIITNSMKEILRRANVEESAIEHTTPVTTYPLGKSPHGVMDMAGNISEMQANFYNKGHTNLAVRGGSWNDNHKYARVSVRHSIPPGYSFYYDIGFRIVVLFSE